MGTGTTETGNTRKVIKNSHIDTVITAITLFAACAVAAIGFVAACVTILNALHG